MIKLSQRISEYQMLIRIEKRDTMVLRLPFSPSRSRYGGARREQKGMAAELNQIVFMIMKKYCLTLDLKDDPQLIEEYKAHHQKVWPEVIESIKASGISNMEIYLLGNRLCMLVEAEDSFSFEQKAAMDSNNQKVEQWEALMWKYQKELPLAQPGQKWMLMDKIFDLNQKE